MHLILTGATGLIGSATLDAMLKMQEISKVSILSRRPVAMAEQAKDPRVNVIIHKDFNNYPLEVLSQLEGASGAVWALGVSQKLVSAEVYVTITKDYALAGAKAFADLAAGNKPFRFIYVSGMGATVNPGRFTQTFARVKGETEFLLDRLRATIPKLAIESVRPGGVDSTDHPAIKPFIPSVFLAQKAALTFFLPLMRHFARGYLTPTEPMGRLFAELAMGKHQSALAKPVKDIGTLKGGLRILENTALRRLGNME